MSRSSIRDFRYPSAPAEILLRQEPDDEEDDETDDDEKGDGEENDEEEDGYSE